MAPTVRLMPWWHLGVGVAVATAIVWLRWRDPWHTVPAAVQSLQVAMVPLALSAAFTLDDPTERTLAACPVPTSLRRGLRLAGLLSALAALWAALLAFAAAAPAFRSVAPPGGTAGTAPEAAAFLLPVVGLSLQFAGVVAMTLAAAAVADRATDGEAGGVAAAPATLAVTLGLWLLPARYGLFVEYAPAPAPGEPPGAGWLVWVDAHWRWAIVAAVAAAGLAWASRDLGRRRLLAVMTGRDRRKGRPTAGAPSTGASAGQELEPIP